MFKKHNVLIPIIIVILSSSFHIASGEKKNIKWKNISGRWKISRDNNKSCIIETKARTRDWGYSELINYNSIITIDPIDDYTSIQFTMEIQNPKQSSVDLMTFFAVKNYRDFYAFKFSGDGGALKKIQFINSKIIDTTQPPARKWNYKISKLFTSQYKLAFNKKYNIEINIAKNTALLCIDGKRVCKVETEENLNNGKFGFGNRNALLQIADVKVCNGKITIFQDDFSTDTIIRKKFKGTAVKKRKEI